MLNNVKAAERAELVEEMEQLFFTEGCGMSGVFDALIQRGYLTLAQTDQPDETPNTIPQILQEIRCICVVPEAFSNRSNVQRVAQILSLAERGIALLASQNSRATTLVREISLGWQPIETAPKDGNCIIGWITTRDGHTKSLANSAMIFWDDRDKVWLTAYAMKPIENSSWYVKYWRPDVEPPTTEIEGQS